MALEATLLVETEAPVSFTCANGTAIPKGTFLKIADPNTVSIAGTDDDAVVGIAAEEKIASDGNTQIAVWMRGIIKCTAGAAGVTAGDHVSMDSSTGDDNEVATIAAAEVHSIGMALETATDLQTFKLWLNPCLGQP